MRDIAIGHHHNHGLGLALGDEVVEDLGSTAKLAPRILVATDAMQQVEHGILLAAGLIAGRGVDGDATCQTSRRTLVPDLAHGAVGHLVHLVEVCTGIAADEQHVSDQP